MSKFLNCFWLFLVIALLFTSTVSASRDGTIEWPPEHVVLQADDTGIDLFYTSAVMDPGRVNILIGYSLINFDNYAMVSIFTDKGCRPELLDPGWHNAYAVTGTPIDDTYIAQKNIIPEPKQRLPSTV